MNCAEPSKADLSLRCTFMDMNQCMIFINQGPYNS